MRTAWKIGGVQMASSTVSKGKGQDGAFASIVKVNVQISVEDAKSQYLSLSNKLVTLYSQG